MDLPGQWQGSPVECVTARQPPIAWQPCHIIISLLLLAPGQVECQLALQPPATIISLCYNANLMVAGGRQWDLIIALQHHLTVCLIESMSQAYLPSHVGSIDQRVFCVCSGRLRLAVGEVDGILAQGLQVCVHCLVVPLTHTP